MFTVFCLSFGYSTAQAGTTENGSAGSDTGLFKVVEKELSSLADEFLAEATLNKKFVYFRLKKYLRAKPHIYGAAFAFAPERKKSSPYVYRSGIKFVKKDLNDSYEYESHDWYASPVKHGQAVWSDPYFDEGGGEAWMKTYSIPLYSDKGKKMLIGVITSDVLIAPEQLK